MRLSKDALKGWWSHAHVRQVLKYPWQPSEQQPPLALSHWTYQWKKKETIHIFPERVGGTGKNTALEAK